MATGEKSAYKLPPQKQWLSNKICKKNPLNALSYLKKKAKAVAEMPVFTIKIARA